MGLIARVKQKWGKGKDASEEETLVKRVQKRQRLLQLVQSRLSSFSALLLLAGLLCMAVIPAEPLGKALKVSENAVQAGQITTYWDWQDVFVADKFAQDVQQWSTRPALERAGELEAAFKKLGLPATSQSYYFSSASANQSGVNTHAILKAPKTDGAEAVVLAASWLSRDGQRLNTRGVALVLGLAKYLSKYAVWSKDIIFLISDGYSEGAQAWITSYHSLQHQGLQAEPLQLTTGSIWAALYLDYPHHSFKQIGLYFEGVNGLLPNLDLIAAVGHITRWIGGVAPLVNNASEALPQSTLVSGNAGTGNSPFDNKWVQDYRSALANVLEQVKRQSVGTASGPEGVYAPFRIDALALFAIPAEGPHGFYALGKIAEASLRSINNLLERFHASAFLYILTAPRRFVPLAHYLAAPLLCGLAMSFKGLSIWATWVKQDSSDTAKPRGSASLVLALVAVAATHLYGALVHSALKACKDPTEMRSLALMLLPTTLVFAVSTSQWLPPSSTAPLQAINLLLSGMVISVAAVVNFSLACLAALSLTVSVYLLGSPSSSSSSGKGSLSRSAKPVLLVLASLPALTLVLPNSLLASLLFDWRVLGVWFLDLATLVLAPLQLQSLITSCSCTQSRTTSVSR